MPKVATDCSQFMDPWDHICIEPKDFPCLLSEEASCCLYLLPFLIQSAPNTANTGSNKQAFFWITAVTF